jgi:hypothetical protein
MDLPANYIAIGDSVMCLNPVFGFVPFPVGNRVMALILSCCDQPRHHEGDVWSLVSWIDSPINM